MRLVASSYNWNQLMMMVCSLGVAKRREIIQRSIISKKQKKISEQTLSSTIYRPPLCVRDRILSFKLCEASPLRPQSTETTQTTSSVTSTATTHTTTVTVWVTTTSSTVTQTTSDLVERWEMVELLVTKRSQKTRKVMYIDLSYLDRRAVC